MTTAAFAVAGDDADLPRNFEAEQAVLGSLLLDRDAIIEVNGILRPDDFAFDAHSTLYRLMLDLYEQRQPVDLVTVVEEARRRDLLDRIGKRGYPVTLANITPTAVHVEHYARIVERLAVLRRLISAGSQIMGIARAEAIEADDAIGQAEEALRAVTQRRTTLGFEAMPDILARILERLDFVHENRGAIVGVPTGFIDLDKILGGLQRSDLVILGARPAHGKCLTADTLIDDPLTGERVTIERFVREKRPFVSGMARDGSVETKAIGAWIDSGVKPCFLVRTRTGREVKVTGHHPFFTVHGWTPLHDLRVGSSIAVPAQLPIFGTNTDMPHDLVRLLAYYIAEGSVSAAKKCPGFTNTDPVLVDDFTAIIGRHFPTCAIRRYGIDYYVSQPRSAIVAGTGAIMPPNPVRRWLESVGAYGERAEGKSFPACIWGWDKPTLALFLRVLMSCDGSIHANRGRPRIEFAVASHKLASDVHHALLRFGIIAFMRQKTQRCWSVVITGDRDIGTYQREIGWIGEKAARFAAWVSAPAKNGGNAGHLPAEIWPEVKLHVAAASLSLVEVARRAGETTKVGKHAGYNPHCSRGLPTARATAYARVLAWPELITISNPDMYWDEIVRIEAIGEHQVYDLTVPDGSNFVANGVFVHNTALALGMCHNAAIRYKQRIAIFSLEMSKEQLVQRLLCMQGRLDSGRLRSGYIDEDEWTRLIEAAAVLSESKIFIDDSAGTNPAEMRNRARRLQAEQGLDLIVVDYLQLMSGRSSENRVQEISGISRALKILARELNVPVLALSQVSRGVDSRTSHVPLLSDLRESGCLAGDSPVYLPDEGTYRPIADLVGKSGFRVLAVNTVTWHLEPATVSAAFSTGVKPAFRLATRLGRTITATANHRFLTVDGWKHLDELATGDHLALPRSLPGPLVDTMTASELALLGHLIGDGCTLPRHAIQYTTRELGIAETVAALASDVFGAALRPRIARERQWYQVYLASVERLTHRRRNPVATWMDDLGVFGLRSWEKHVPARVFHQPAAGIATFLRHLWATDGCVFLGSGPRPIPRIFYASSSERLARGVQSLLLRLGITARVRRQPQPQKGRDQWHVIVSGQPDTLRFIETIGAIGERKAHHAQAIVAQASLRSTNTNRDVLPASVWRSIVVPAMQASGLTTRQVQHGLGMSYCGDTLYKSNLGRERAERVAAVVASKNLEYLAASDIYWDQIATIEPAGEIPVYDLTVERLHNFVAADIIVHNSIEQDADVVVFLCREEMYDPETEKRHIADLYIAKHRNGPTGHLALYFDQQQTRFRDLETHQAGPL